MSIFETINISDPSDSNQVAGKSANITVSADMSPEDQADLKSIIYKFQQWKKVRDTYSKPWLDYYKLFRGVQWGTNRANWKSSEVVNLIWQTIQSQAPLQTDARPRFIFLPSEPSDIEFAALIEKISDQDWDKWGWMQTVLEVIYDGYVYGTGFSSMKYNFRALYGLGAPEYVSADPFYCYPDPDCNDINDDKCEGFFYAYPCTTSKLKARFPKFSDKIKPNMKEWLKIKKASVKNDAFYTFYRSSTHDLPQQIADMGTAEDSDIQKTYVIEGFLKPNDLEEITDETPDENGEVKKTYTVKKKYPKGRHVVIANGIFLQNEELPFEDGLIPYSKYVNYSDPREFFGISEVEQLESPQRVFNKILSYALDIMVYCSNPGWVVSNDADVDTDKLTNQPGLIVEKSPGGEVQRFQGAQLPPHFMQFLEAMRAWFNNIAGQSEFSEGKAPGGVTAASAIEQLLNASRTRIKQKQRNLDNYLRSVGRQYLNRVLEFYTIPRIYRMTNEDGTNYWLKFHIEKVPDDSGDQQTWAVLESYDLAPNNQIKTNFTKRLMLKGELDVRVQAGSDLPFEAADKERKALALFDRGIIDAAEVLDQLQYPNREKILARIEQISAQQAAQQGNAAPQQQQ